MVDRRERVILELQDDATSGMVRFAASVALARRELDALNGSTANFNSNVTRVNTQRSTTNITNMGRSADQAGGSINQLTGRLGLLADAFITLGPGLIPIGAVGAQAIGGLAAAATAAATAAGSAIVAFQGLGDAVKTVQEYQLNPTFDGLEKAREAMRKLGPDAQRFVMEFQKFRPVLSDIKGAAEAGWFPGLTESLDGFARLGPQIEDIFFKAGETGGFLVDSIADSLSSDRWAPFLDFLADETPTAIASLTRTMGDLTHGLAEMFQTFDPGNDAFLGWLEGVADGFDKWASSSSGQETMGDFLEYARVNGPAVGDFFSSLVGALAAIVKAAAPLGGPVLTGLTAVADAIKAIADSDMATPILAAVAAMRLYARVTAIAAATQGAFGGAQAGTAAVAASNASRAAAVNAAGLTGTALGSALYANRPGSGAPGAGAQPSRMGTVVGALGPTALILGAAYAVSKAAAANNDFVSSARSMQESIDAMDFASFANGIATVAKEQSDFEAKIQRGLGFGSLKDPEALLANTKNAIEGVFGKSDVEENAEEYAALEKQMINSQEAAAGLGEAFGMSIGPLDNSARSVAELERALASAKPAMDALGISQEDLNRAQAQQAALAADPVDGTLVRVPRGGSLTPFDDMTGQLRDQAKYMDSAQGKAEGYTAALSALVREQGTASERAQELNDRLSAMFDPALNAEEALSNVRELLKTISQLDSDGGFTVKNAIGRSNLEETRAYSVAVRERLTTMVEAKRSEEDVARALAVSRQQFIQSGVAAGFSAGQMRRRANAIGLTPKLVETTFRTLKIDEVDRKVWQLRDMLNSLPKNVRTQIREDGAIPSKKRAMELIQQLDLAAKPRRALLRLVAEGEGNVAAAKRLMESVRDRTATITILTRRITELTTRGVGPAGRADNFADGGYTGPGGKYEPAGIVHRGEVVIPQELVKRDWSMLSNRYGHLPGFADGGVVDTFSAGGFRDTLSNSEYTSGPVGRESRETARGLKALKRELEESTAALSKERQQRASLIDTVRTNFSSDPFATDGDIWGAGAGNPISALQGDIGDLRKFQAIIRRLGKNGLKGGALAEVDSLAEAQLLAGMSRSELRDYQRLYGQRQRLATQVGGVYANQVGASTSDIKELQAEVKGLRADVRAADRNNRKDRKENGKETADRLSNAVNGAATAGWRDRKKDRR